MRILPTLLMTVAAYVSSTLMFVEAASSYTP